MKAVRLLLLLLFPAVVFTQSWHFQQHSVGEGLPQSQVYSLLQDSRGYLWLGTQGGGLARFDGINFKNYASKDGLQGSYVNAILEDKSGNLWLGTNKGVNRFDGKHFQHFDLAKFGDPTIFAMTFDAEGTLWAAGQAGIFSIQKDNVAHTSHVGGKPFGKLTAAFTDRSGKVWLGGDDGIFKLENGIWHHVWKRQAEVLSFAETTDGQLLAAVFHIGILRFDPDATSGQWSVFLNKNQGLPSNRVQCLWRAPGGEIWVGTQDAGACVLSGSTTNHQSPITYFNTAQGLCNQNIRAILGDLWGNVWLGTSGSGACKYGGQEFEHFDAAKGLRSNFVYALCADTSGGIWLSAGERGISFFNGKTFRHFGQDSNFVNEKCKALHQDRSGRLWVGTEGRGLAVLQNGIFRFFSKNAGLAGNWIRDIKEDAAGNIWVATTDGGISKITVNDLASSSIFFKNFGRSEGLNDLNINALHFDKTGRLWFAAAKGGIGFLKNERATLLGAASSLPDVSIRCLAEDTLGYLWCGTAGRGVGRVAIYPSQGLQGSTGEAQGTGGSPSSGDDDTGDDTGFKFFDQNDRLTSANVYLLQFDAAGNLWVGSETGVDRLTLDAARNVSAVQHFSRAEGFRGIETCQNAALLDRQGSLWFGTVNGLTRFQPAADSTSTAPPKLGITGVRLFYESIERTGFQQFATNWGGLKSGAVFPYDQNHLGFEFFALNFSKPEKVAYSWQLVGSEEAWSPFSARNEVSYANLPPDSYQFRVRARNEDGVITAPEVAAFLIEPPFWQTWWFRILAIAAVGIVVFLVFRWRIRQVKNKAAQAQSQLEMQNRLLTLEQKARQLQMNPHFIFNALNSIQSLVTAGDTDMARQYILKFGRLMRAVLDNSRQALIPLEKEIETLRQYIEMEQFCRGGNFDFDIKTTVASDDLQIPPMLLQPFVENAILHGIAPLTVRRGKIEVAVFEKDGFLEVFVRDNGVGFAHSEKIHRDKTRQSAGIAVTRERLEMLHGKQEVKHLSNENGEVAGTEIRLHLPVK